MSTFYTSNNEVDKNDFNMLHTETMPDCSVNVDEHFCGELSSICKHCS
ncbi:hypothetical protein AAJ76_3090001956, partial [Vairimorpha ceranae]